MSDLVVLVIIFAILAAAGGYIYSEKKKGAKCIGCASGEACNSKKNHGSNCNCSQK